MDNSILQYLVLKYRSSIGPLVAALPCRGMDIAHKCWTSFCIKCLCVQTLSVVICPVWSWAAGPLDNMCIKWPITPHGITPGCKRRSVLLLFLVDFIFPVSFIHRMWHIRRLYFGIKDTILQHIGKLICFSQLVLCPNMNPQGQTRVYRLRENEPQQQVAFCCLMNTAICCYHCYAFHQTIRQLSM